MLILRGVDPIDIFEKYREEKYASNIHEKVHMKKIKSFSVIKKYKDEHYLCKDLLGNSVRIRTIGNKASNCLRCSCKLDDKTIMGIPTKIRNVKTANGRQTIITMYKSFCCIECVYTYLLDKLKYAHDVFYDESMAILKFIARKNGITEIHRLDEIDHLEKFGGTKSYDNYHSNNDHFIYDSMNIERIRTLSIET